MTTASIFESGNSSASNSGPTAITAKRRIRKAYARITRWYSFPSMRRTVLRGLNLYSLSEIQQAPCEARWLVGYLTRSPV